MDERSSAGDDRKKRWVVAVGSVAITSLFAYLAFLLGAWGFDARRFGQHQRRMQNLLHQAPQLDQVEQAFRDEGTLLLARPGSLGELRQQAVERAGPRSAEVLEKGTR
jgi:hypothetical protein